MKTNKVILSLIPLFMLISACTGNNNGNNPISSGGGNNNPPTPPNPDGYVKDEGTIYKPGETLPIGNVVTTPPSNIDNKVDIKTEKTYSFYKSFPSEWSFIQGNNKTTGYGFYAETAEGGLKFTKVWYGIQSPAFTSYKYVDVKFKVSSVNNASGKDEVKKENIFDIYGYNSQSNCILTKYITQGQITTETVGNYVSFTICNDSMAYFEMRLNSKPFKGEQPYNFGISEITIKGRDLTINKSR